MNVSFCTYVQVVHWGYVSPRLYGKSRSHSLKGDEVAVGIITPSQPLGISMVI